MAEEPGRPAPGAGVPDRASTLVEVLVRAGGAGRRSEETGLRFFDRRERTRFLSWRTVRRRAAETASRLALAGVAPGDRVALVYPTGEEFFDAFFGTLLAGAVPVPLYPPVRLGRLDEYHRRTAAMLAAVGARLVLADRRVRRLLGPAVAGTDYRPDLGCPALDGLPEPDRDATTSERAPAPDDLALIQFSSGTTADPKPVALDHRAVLAQTRLLTGFWPDPPDESGGRHSGLSWLPLYHDMGLIGCVFPALERIADLTLIGPEVFVARPAIWLRALSETRATISPAPNFAYGLCVRKVRDEDLEGVDLSCWSCALNGAESISPGTLRAFIERFGPYGFRPEAITPVYGLSEAGLAVTFSPLDARFTTRRYDRASLAPGEAVRPVDASRGGVRRPREGGAEPATRELVSVGVPVPGFQVELRPPEGGAQALPKGRVGRVWVRGPSLMRDYFGRPEATARALVDGWLDTGDLGFIDDGELYLTGRAKDLVIVRGRNVAPEEIERMAAGVPGARPGCAVAVSYMPEDDPEADSEVLAVFVERARDARARSRLRLVGAVEEAVLGGVGLVCDRVVVLEPGTLPRTSSGKLRRAETLRQWQAGSLAPPARMGPVRLGAALLRSSRALARSTRSRSRVDPEGEGV